MGMEARTAQWAQCAIKCKSPQRFIMHLTAQGVACCAPTKNHHSVEKG